jgi:ABC-type transport system substrate-binding protein
MVYLKGLTFASLTRLLTIYVIAAGLFFLINFGLNFFIVWQQFRIAATPRSESGQKKRESKRLHVGIVRPDLNLPLLPLFEENSLGLIVTDCIFDGLFNFEGSTARGELPVPALAERLTIHPTGQELRWEILLKRGKLWHNGQEFRARDVIDTLEYLTEVERPGYQELRANLGAISTVPDKPDTIFLTLRHPLSFSRLSELLTVKILPSGLIDMLRKFSDENWNWLREPLRFGPNLAPFLSNIVGTGPYRLKNITDHLIRIERNPHYETQPRPAIDEIVFHVMSEPEPAIHMLEKEAFQLLLGVPPQYTRQVHKNIPFKDYPNFQIYTLVLNPQSELFHDQKFRQAITMLIDRPAVAKQLVQDWQLSETYRAAGVFPEYFLDDEFDLPAALGREFDPTPDQPEMAGALLTAASPKASPGFYFEITIDGRDPSGAAAQLAHILANMLMARSQPDFSIEVAVIPRRNNYESYILFDRRVEAMIMPITFKPPLPLWLQHCQSQVTPAIACNLEKFSQQFAQAREIMADIRQRADSDAKKHLLGELSQLLGQDHAFKFLLEIPSRAYYQRNLRLHKGLHPQHLFSSVKYWFLNGNK